MSHRTKRTAGLGIALAACVLSGMRFVPMASAARSHGEQPQGSPAAIGQSSTQLADGRWLLLGGESAAGVARSAAIVDPRTGVSTPLPTSMTAPRAQHTATLLTDGTVLIVGGRGALGEVVETAELFDPQLEAFMPIAFEGGTPRAGHSATLLSDGRVLVAGGAAAGGRSASELEIWDVSAQRVVEAGRLGRARSAQTATLLGDGRVAFSDGVDADGRPVPQVEIFDPRSGRVVAATPPDDDGAPVRVMEATPGDSALDVPVDVRLALRFSRPLRIDTVNASTVTLSGTGGRVDVLVVPAEGGRLLFVTPRAPLQHDATYTLTLAGAFDVLGGPLATPPLTFVTVAENSTIGHAPDEEAWAPGADGHGWKSNRPDSPWRSLQPLQAPPGVTALAGQVLRLDGKPLPDVTLAMEGHSVRSDRTGRFLLRLDGLVTGEHTLVIDARTANRPGRTYGFYEARIGAYAGRTTVLPFTIWSPLLDTAHAIEIASPTTGEMVVTTPTMPGLELHLPAGTVIHEEDGQVVRKVTMTPIPLDRTPFALPEDATFTMFFTIQPGGAYIDTPGPIKGGWLVYPTRTRHRAGTKVQFFNYDPDDKGWYVYGMGTVTATAVVPNATTRFYAFTGASFNDGNTPPPPGPPPGDCCGNDGDPVNLTTGIFTYEMTDLVVPDVLPLVLTRTYNSQDTNPNSPRPFGIGMTHPYAIFPCTRSSSSSRRT